MAFGNGGEIPARFTCDGDDVSPALAWSGAPSGTRSLALVVEDPDAPDPAAPQRTWSHWVLYDLPPDSSVIPEGSGHAGLPAGTRQGLNDWNRTGWGGPCPPIGRHRYFFRLFALDLRLGHLHTPTRRELLDAMEGHVLAIAETMGTYERRRPGK
jgi:hypothetical protein